MKAKVDNPFLDNTHTSMMRICQFICVVASVIIAILCVVLGRDLGSSAALVGAILGPAFIGKAVQSFSEAPEK